MYYKERLESKDMKIKNPFATLGVIDNTSVNECRKQYRLLCTKYHPDNIGGDSDKFNEITLAWEMIKEGYIIKKEKRAIHRRDSMFRFDFVE